jgi:hypothetical protein
LVDAIDDTLDTHFDDALEGFRNDDIISHNLSPTKFDVDPHSVMFDEPLLEVGSPTHLLNESEPDDEQEEEEEGVPLISLDNVLSIVNQLSEKKLTPNDLDAFEALRTWGSLQEIQQTVSSLSFQRDSLLNR